MYVLFVGSTPTGLSFCTTRSFDKIDNNNNNELKAKHPCSQPICEEALLSPSAATSSFHPVVFDTLNGVSIRCAALRTKGAAGPSGVDAFCWR